MPLYQHISGVSYIHWYQGLYHIHEKTLIHFINFKHLIVSNLFFQKHSCMPLLGLFVLLAN